MWSGWLLPQNHSAPALNSHHVNPILLDLQPFFSSSLYILSICTRHFAKLAVVNCELCHNVVYSGASSANWVSVTFTSLNLAIADLQLVSWLPHADVGACVHPCLWPLLTFKFSVVVVPTLTLACNPHNRSSPSSAALVAHHTSPGSSIGLVWTHCDKSTLDRWKTCTRIHLVFLLSPQIA